MAKPAAGSKSAKQQKAAAKSAVKQAVAKKAAPIKATAKPGVKNGAPAAGKQATRRAPSEERTTRPDVGRRHLFGPDVRRAVPDSDQIVKVPKSKALPGENEILAFTPRRGPITDAEALGRLRRSERLKMAAAGGVDEAAVAAALPEWNTAPSMMSVRFPRRLKLLVDAKVEVEEISLSAYLELLVWEDVNRPVRSPEQVRRALLAMRKHTIGMEKLDKAFGA